jgi:hypothetical protein
MSTSMPSRPPGSRLESRSHSTHRTESQSSKSSPSPLSPASRSIDELDSAIVALSRAPVGRHLSPARARPGVRRPARLGPMGL